jgi:predicted DNA-binding transcriptional regulator YafY
MEKWRGRWVELIYEDRRGVLSQRTVYVQRVEGKYMIAFCSARQAPRRFAIDRVLSLLPVVRHAG